MGDFITGDGVRLHYEEYGTGDRCVLSAMAGLFYPFGLQQALAERGYRVFCMTLRGFAPSGYVSQDYGSSWYDVFARDVAELADRLGISKSSVSMYERGNREPELDLLEKMADLFGVGVSALLGREEPLVNGDPELTEYLESLRDRPELRMLFSVTKNAAREDVEAAVKIIEALRSGK